MINSYIKEDNQWKADKLTIAKKYFAQIIRNFDRKNNYIHILTRNKNNKIFSYTWDFYLDKDLICYIGDYQSSKLKQIESILYFSKNKDRQIGYNMISNKLVRVCNNSKNLGSFSQKIKNFKKSTDILIIIEYSKTAFPIVLSFKSNSYYKSISINKECQLASDILLHLDEIISTPLSEICYNNIGDAVREIEPIIDHMGRSIVAFDMSHVINSYKNALDAEYIEFYKDGEVKTYINNETKISMTSKRTVINDKVFTITRTYKAFREEDNTDVIIDIIHETFDKDNNTYQYKSDIFFTDITIMFTKQSWTDIEYIKLLDTYYKNYNYLDKNLKLTKTDPNKVDIGLKVTINPDNLDMYYATNNIHVSGKYIQEGETVTFSALSTDTYYDDKLFQNKFSSPGKSYRCNYSTGFNKDNKVIVNNLVREGTVKISIGTSNKMTQKAVSKYPYVDREITDSLLGIYELNHNGESKYYFSPVLTTKKYTYERDSYGVPYKRYNSFTDLLKNFIHARNFY